MEKKFFNVAQTAKRLDVSSETVYNMLKDGRLGGRYSRGQNKKKGSWLISIESIVLFEKETSIKSIYQVKAESNQRTLF